MFSDSKHVLDVIGAENVELEIFSRLMFRLHARRTESLKLTLLSFFTEMMIPPRLNKVKTTEIFYDYSVLLTKLWLKIDEEVNVIFYPNLTLQLTTFRSQPMKVWGIAILIGHIENHFQFFLLVEHPPLHSLLLALFQSSINF